MKNKSHKRKKDGFTLIEVIVTIAILGIVSIGIHGMYLRMIKGTRTSQEKQGAAVLCKRTLEDIKTVPSDKFVLSGGSVIIDDVSFAEDDLNKAGISFDSLEFSGNKDSFSTKLYLTDKYKYCKSDNPKCSYEQNIKIVKVKASGGAGEGSDGTEQDVDIDMNVDNIDEDSEGINDDVNTMELEYSVNKEKDSDIVNLGEEKIGEDEGKLVLNVYIEKSDTGKASVVIKDENGNVLAEEKDINFSSDQLNYLNIHFNFAAYELEHTEDDESEEKPKDMLINVYNRIEKDDDFKANIYIEKDVDVNVDVKACKGDVYYYELGADKDIKRIGPLYAVYVELKSKETGETLFSTHTTKNIDIKDEIDSETEDE